MKKFLCYDTNDAASGKIDVDSRGMLKSTGSSAQGDWNVTDSADPAFIKNKPFGMAKGEVIRFVSRPSLRWSSYNYQQYSYRTSTDIQNIFAPLSQITNTEAIRIEVNGVLYDDLVIEQREDGNSLDTDIYSDDCPVLIKTTLGKYNPSYSQVYIYSKSFDADSVKVIDLDGEGGIVKKIDAQYLYQADWNENDSSSPAYILNKPETTWFTISFTNSSWDGNSSNIKKGEVWATGSSTTSEELFDAFKNGLVRAHITDTTNPSRVNFGTLNGVSQLTSCGATSNTFTFIVDEARHANISFS